MSLSENINIEIRGKNLNITDVVKSKIEVAIITSLEKYSKHINEEPKVHVDISQYEEKLGSHVRVTLNIKKGTIHSEAKNDDLFMAIEESMRKIESQIKSKIRK